MARIDERVGQFAEIVDVTASESGWVAQEFEGRRGGQ